ncbi:MAG: hypothetical protein ABIS47_07425 [Acidimicrobiales bacterium]
MAIERLPENVRTAPVARAMFSPSAILLGGGAASLVILAGLWPLAPVAALLGWGAKVALAVPRSARRSTINPGKLPDPWRTFVLEAAQAAKRFDGLVKTLPSGPLRAELTEVAARVAEGVRECWEIANRGVALDEARKQLGLGQAANEVDRLKGERDLRSRQGMDLASIDRAISAVQRQLAAGQRIETAAFEARDRLRVLNAQLDEAVAAVVEMTLRPSASTSAGAVRGQVNGIVDELEALRLALDETDTLTTAPSPIAPSPDGAPSPTLEQR